MSDEVADVLDGAADALEKYGWIKGQAGTIKSGFCTFGAIGHAMDQQDLLAHPTLGRDTVMALVDHMKKEGFDTTIVPFWNDHVAKDKQEVLDFLRKVAKEQRDV